MKTKEQIKEHLTDVLEKEWSKDVDAEEGKMHEILGIPEDEDIEDHYDSGMALAQDLVDAVGEDEAASMIAFAANVNPEDNIYDDALQELEEIE